MNRPLIKAALRVAERFIQDEMKVRETSYLPEPTESEQEEICECAESLDIVKRAIVDLEVAPLNNKPCGHTFYCSCEGKA